MTCRRAVARDAWGQDTNIQKLNVQWNNENVRHGSIFDCDFELTIMCQYYENLQFFFLILRNF